MSRIEDQLSLKSIEPFSMVIYLKTRTGLSQLYVLFDFKVLGGMMRFDKTVPPPKWTLKLSPLRRKGERDDEKEVVDYDLSMKRRSPLGARTREHCQKVIRFLSSQCSTSDVRGD